MKKRLFDRGWAPVVALALFLGGPAFVRAATISLTVDTSALSGTSGRFEFDLFDGDGVTNNTVTLSNFMTNGTLGAVDCTIGCAGGPPYTLDDSLGFGSLLRDLTLGTFFSFTVDYTNNFGGGSPDQFVVFLLNPNTNFTLVDTSLDSPYGDALALITLDGTNNVQTANAGVSVSAVPEPGSIFLLSAALPLLYFGRRFTSNALQPTK